MNRIFILCLMFQFFANSAHAAEVIGISKPGKKSRVDSDKEEPYYDTRDEEAAMQEERRPRKSRRRSEEAPQQSSDDSSGKSWGLSASLGLGFRSFSGTLTLSHYINRYVGLDLSGFYRTRNWEDYKETEYGPELDLVLRLPNPTIITPYAGAGPGWIKWQRMDKDVYFDTSASFTTNYFVGANLKLTNFLVFQVAHKWITYLNDPPFKFDDHLKREERSKTELSVGLAVVI